MENPAKSRARLLLMGILKDSLETAMTLIGISKPEKM
jgi:arginyl-tRNA synthetase